MKAYKFYPILLIVILSSCKKDQEKLVQGIWKIESVTFNGEEKKNDPSLLGIVKYNITYDPYYYQYQTSSGGMLALTENGSGVLSIPFSILSENGDSILIGCSPSSFLNPIVGSFLPCMIDSSINCSENWLIRKLTNRDYWIEFYYQGNVYNVHMSKN